MTEPSHDVICDYTINGENWEDGGSAAMNKASPLDTMCSNKRPSLFPYWHLIVLSTLIKTHNLVHICDNSTNSVHVCCMEYIISLL